jgi:2-polyprenyl-6-hydroxyphenyl methylase/3-demethylubiquinone-9 3-methyltransferase
MSQWDHSSHKEFFDYYAKQSQSEETLQRYISIRNCILRMIKRAKLKSDVLEVADIGCGAGTQSMLWAELGHRVYGIDVNQPLVELAKERAISAGHNIHFKVGSALALPWSYESMDVCLVLELLEHVADWETCLMECIRIVRPGGVIFITTTNKLCPAQDEFNLPLYSWYPSIIKRYCERLALTTRPELANFAKYPAVNWFTFYGLRSLLSSSGLKSLDRFDVMDLSKKSTLKKLIVYCIRMIPVLRFLAQFFTQGTLIMAVKLTKTEK